MTHLGDFGTARERPAPPEEPTTFGYFGQQFRVNPDLSDDYTMADLSELIITVDTMDGFGQIAAVKRLLRMLVDPRDFDAVWRLGRDNGQTFADLGELAQSLIVAVTDRPTVRPEGSSVGPRPTEGNSGDDSSLQVQRDLEQRGRPDLALIVQEVRSYRQQVSA